MDLIIVESPTKARTLNKFLGSDYLVESTMGHVRDLPKSKLGIDVDHDFKPDYVFVQKKKDVVQRIKKEALKADKVYLATDPDREGEAIAHHVAELLTEKKKLPLQRIVFHEITESAVKHALETPGEINGQLVDAQQARRVLDRLVGYKLSPLLWKKIRRGLSAGRVQSVTVKLIVEREREIEAFKPNEYWEIFSEVKSENSKGQNFLVKLVGKDKEKIKVSNKDEAAKAVSDLEKSTYAISSINKREVKKNPPAPFTTSTLTQAAARNYFWSAKKTMSIAQRLYEEGLITYHRTDSTNLSQQALTMARSFIKDRYGESYLPEKSRMYKVKSKVAQEAHEAIRPTDLIVSNVNVDGVGKDAELLYSLVWRRFLACQMAQAVFDETTIKVSAKYDGVDYLLQVGGQILKFDGWKVLYPTASSAYPTVSSVHSNKEYKNTEEGELQLPEVEEGEKLQLVKVISDQKFTEPPPRYNEASIVKTLEKLGIGRPSTYAPTISTIQDRQYAEKNEGRFYPTSLGIAVNDFLVKYFPDVVDYQFTASMEGDLDRIAKGEKEWVPVIKEFWGPFSGKLAAVEEKAERVKIEVKKTGEKCVKCSEGEQVIRVGRFGKFLSCSRFPDCDWSAPYLETLKIKCPDCGEGDVIMRKTKKGKRFFGCSRYPECKFASWKKPKDAGEVHPQTTRLQKDFIAQAEIRK